MRTKKSTFFRAAVVSRLWSAIWTSLI
jgi:hypothetical protein